MREGERERERKEIRYVTYTPRGVCVCTHVKCMYSILTCCGGGYPWGGGGYVVCECGVCEVWCCYNVSSTDKLNTCLT